MCDHDHTAADHDFADVDHGNQSDDDFHRTSWGDFFLARRAGSWSSIIYDGVR